MKDKYRKSIKNYTAGKGKSAGYFVGQIQDILLSFGATGIGYEYDDQGMISSVAFKIELSGNSHTIRLP